MLSTNKVYDISLSTNACFFKHFFCLREWKNCCFSSINVYLFINWEIVIVNTKSINPIIYLNSRTTCPTILFKNKINIWFCKSIIWIIENRSHSIRIKFTTPFLRNKIICTSFHVRNN